MLLIGLWRPFQEVKKDFYWLWQPVRIFLIFCKKVWDLAEKAIAFLKKYSKIKIYRKKGAQAQDKEAP